MRPFPLLFPLLALLLAPLLAACSSEPGLQGYVEGDYVEVAAPLAGQLQARAVRKGDEVRTGDLLFQLEDARERAALEEAGQDVLRAERALDDLGKGQRPTELAAIRAQLAEARAELDYARTDFERKKRLFEERTISAQELDLARTAYNTASQSVSRIRAELETAGLGARTDEVLAAQAELDAARARRDQAAWNVDQKRQSAPVSGRVQETYFEPGEWVPAGSPVVSLLAPGAVKVIFFVPEPEAGALRVGDEASVSWDGAPGPVAVRIDHVADEAEYTPPVIYSSQSRAKLVFRVEARPLEPTDFPLRPGQPVDVLAAAAPGEGQ